MSCSLQLPHSPQFSRRGFFRIAAGASALASFPIMTESLLAQSSAVKFAGSDVGVHIDANENPLGPSEAARKAIVEILPRSGRYLFDHQSDLKDLFAKQAGIDPDFVEFYPGSSEPLHQVVLSYTDKQHPVVVADPGYEAPLWAAKVSGAEGIKVPLADPKGAATHDVKAMLAASATPGVIYICNPNNPTGTITPREQIEYAVAHAPKETVIMVDEAYIHLSPNAQSCIDLVKAGHNVVVLRTFSKLYGMAGLRLGIIVANPEIQKKVVSLAGMDSLPVTAVAAGVASLLDKDLVPVRRKIIADVRTETVDWLKQKGYKCTPSESNCFMLDMGKPADPTRQALAAREIFVGREWSAWPNYIRISVGSAAEMAAFRKAFADVTSKMSAGLLPDYAAPRAPKYPARMLS
jgi:histidinol-phosphate aminotransferase